MARHYSRAGDLRGGFFPRPAFPEGSDSGQAMVGHLWLEMDLTGETGRWAVPSDREPVAVTDSGTAPDRTTKSWKTVPKSSNDILLGAEGNALVFAVRATSRIRRALRP